MILSAGSWLVPPAFSLDRAAHALLPAAAVRWTHAWDPHGESFIGVGAGVRCVLHSWPERGIVTVDVWAAAPVDLAAVADAVGAELIEVHRF